MEKVFRAGDGAAVKQCAATRLLQQLFTSAGHVHPRGAFFDSQDVISCKLKNALTTGYCKPGGKGIRYI
ncbi:hypothetical protein [uncultured Clostridium sp.]|uniref:hypothetical protein n=1 Tax=uncultured Clostridium sp. TaxID=59620 RepID=UPI0025D5416C|nr:hypothetical protein [uncultured Clostridium sp.]